MKWDSNAEPVNRGADRVVFLTPDKTAEVVFFGGLSVHRDEIQRKLLSLLGRNNPTLGLPNSGKWDFLFCWPQRLIGAGDEISRDFLKAHHLFDPPLAFVLPCIRERFFFRDSRGRMLEKVASWFVSETTLRHLPDEERGNVAARLDCCFMLASAVELLHSAGIVLADLSPRSFVIDLRDPAVSFLFELDEFELDGFSTVGIVSTPGYAAPDVVAGFGQLSFRANLHSLAVLIYKMLLLRHPLEGPKINGECPEEDQKLSMGQEALFIEHPSNTSNRPERELIRTIASFGPEVESCFLRAFVDGLHAPEKRPSTAEWQAALRSALHMCGRNGDESSL
jgi:hypothetical protein